MCAFYPQTNLVAVLKQGNCHVAYYKSYEVKGNILKREEIKRLFTGLSFV
jgi:hypothetical protein